MKKRAVIIGFSMLSGSFCWGEGPSTLIGIINKSPYYVTVQSTDKNAGQLIYDGLARTNENTEFDLSKVTSMSYVIPYKNWGTHLAIQVWEDDSKKKLIADALLLDEKINGAPSIHLVKKSGTVIDRSFPKNGNEIGVTLLVDESGTISMPPIYRVNFENGTGVTMEIGSPNCSIEMDQLKQNKEFKPGDKGSISFMLASDNCKLQAYDSQTHKKAVACFNIQGKQVQCDDCDEDITGLPSCVNLGIVWVRGNNPSDDAQHKREVTPTIPGYLFDLYYGFIPLILDVPGQAGKIFGGGRFKVGCNIQSEIGDYSSYKYDFDNAFWRFDTIMQACPLINKKQFTNEFCDYIARDSSHRNFYRFSNNHLEWYYSFKKYCPKTAIIMPDQISPAQAAERLFKGGDLRPYFINNVSADIYKILTVDKGITSNAPSSFAAAFNNFSEIYFWMQKDGKNSQAEDLRKAFCNYSLNDPFAKELSKGFVPKNPRDFNQLIKFNNICKGKQ